MHLVNLTPHALVVQSAHGSITLKRDPRGPARVIESRDDAPLFGAIVTPEGYVDVEALGRPTRIEGLPPPEDDVVFVVSRLVLESPLTANRDDLLCPDTGPQGVIRDGAGQIIGTRRLLRRSNVASVRLTDRQQALLETALMKFDPSRPMSDFVPVTYAQALLGLELPALSLSTLGLLEVPIVRVEKEIARSLTPAERREWAEGKGDAICNALRRDWRERLGIALGGRTTDKDWLDIYLAFEEAEEPAHQLARDVAARRIERLLAEAEARNGGTT